MRPSHLRHYGIHDVVYYGTYYGTWSVEHSIKFGNQFNCYM